ncbi:hypothetical protein NHJ13734_001406 [Beauveria thailandica]
MYCFAYQVMPQVQVSALQHSTQMSHDSSNRPANMLSVAEYQSRYDEISELCRAAKKYFSMSNAKKRKISEQFKAAHEDLRVASKADMASPRGDQQTSNEASGSNSSGNHSLHGGRFLDYLLVTITLIFGFFCGNFLFVLPRWLYGLSCNLGMT